jgi:NTE family protein
MPLDANQPYAENKILWEQTPMPRHVGLVLSGGAARGAAHVGVLEVLDEARIPIHNVVGVSAGSIVGGLYAAGVSPLRMRSVIGQMGWGTISSIHIPSLRWGGFNLSAMNLPMGLFSLDKLIGFVHGITGGPVDFENLNIPFAAVAADVTRDEAVVLNQGDIAEAMRISSSVPGIFVPVRRAGRLLVDGGAVNNLPVSVARQMGAEYVIAVDLLPPEGTNFAEPSNMLDLVFVSIYSLVRATQTGANLANVRISPDIAHINMADFSQTETLLAAGRAAAEAALPEIKAALGLV